jgi:hypothetical protein
VHFLCHFVSPENHQSSPAMEVLPCIYASSERAVLAQNLAMSTFMLKLVLVLFIKLLTGRCWKSVNIKLKAELSTCISGASGFELTLYCILC